MFTASFLINVESFLLFVYFPIRLMFHCRLIVYDVS